MALEAATYISDLNATNPTSGDPKSQGDDHLRLIKSTLQATFPNVNGAVTATPTQLNRVTGSNSLVVDRAYVEYTANADISTTIPLDDTIPQNTEGTQILSVSLTPKSATNRVRLRFQGEVSGGAAINVIVAVFSGASANALRANVVSTSGAGFNTGLVLEHEYVPGVTTAVTYTVRVGSATGATFRLNGSSSSRFFGGVSAATLVVEELAV